MPLVRRLLAQRTLVALVCLAALCMKMLVPTGYMVVNDGGHIRVTICSGVEPRTVTMAMPGMHGDMAGHDMPDQGQPQEHGKAEMPCAFTALSAAALGAADIVLLVALVAFIMATALFTSALPAPPGPAYLRPPLRGPPILI